MTEDPRIRRKARRYSEEQIVGVLKEAESSVDVADVCRQHGVSDATFYNWRRKYYRPEYSEIHWLCELEAESARFSHMVAQQAMDISAQGE